MKFKITERDPLMCFWEEDYTLGGTRNQRDNDHDEIQAERHCQEIDNKLSKIKLSNNPKELYDPVRYMLKMKSKRVRPILINRIQVYFFLMKLKLNKHHHNL